MSSFCTGAFPLVLLVTYPLCLVGVARTDGEAADELMKALRRKDSSVLDVLVECLKEQEAANANLIKSIRDGEWDL